MTVRRLALAAISAVGLLQRGQYDQAIPEGTRQVNSGLVVFEEEIFECLEDQSCTFLRVPANYFDRPLRGHFVRRPQLSHSKRDLVFPQRIDSRQQGQ